MTTPNQGGATQQAVNQFGECGSSSDRATLRKVLAQAMYPRPNQYVKNAGISNLECGGIHVATVLRDAALYGRDTSRPRIEMCVSG